MPRCQLFRWSLAALLVSAAAAASPAIDVSRLDQARARASTDPVDGERALHETVLALSRQKPDDALRARVEALTRFSPQAWTDAPDPDHARGARVPVADIAAAARRTLRAWDVSARAERVQADWLRGATPADIGDVEVATAALDTLDATRLDAVLATGVDRLPVEALATIASRVTRSDDRRVILRVLQEGRGAASLAFVAGLADGEAPAMALADLRAAARNPVLTTAACGGLAALIPRTGAARDALFELLDDPQAGPSAAQALATLGDAATLARVDAALEGAARTSATGSASSPDVRRLLLILQRMPGHDGAPRLARFVDDARHPAALREEVAGWVSR